MAQLIGVSFHTPKCCGFNSQSGHIPRLQVPSPDRKERYGRKPIDASLSHQYFFLSLSLSLSLPPSLSNISKTYPQVRIKNKKREKTEGASTDRREGHSDVKTG